MVQIIGQEGLGELLGGSVGKGFSEGVNQLTQHHLQKLLLNKKQEAANFAKQSAPFNPLDVKGILTKLNIPKFQLDLMNISEFQDISNLANEKISQGLDRQSAITQAANEFLNPAAVVPSTGNKSLDILQNARQTGEAKQRTHQDIFNEMTQKYPDSPGAVIGKGVESSIPGRTGAILRGEGLKDFEERTKLKAPNWWKNALYTLSKFGAESPIFATGGLGGASVGTAAGGPLGGVVGGGAGALSLPAMLETALIEYQKYLDKDGKGSFGDFIESTNEVLKSGLHSSAEGSLLSTLGPLSVLKKVPGFKQLFQMKGGKVAQNLLDTGVKAGVFTTAQAVSKGEFPSASEYGNNLALFLGFDALHAAGKYKNQVYKDLKKAGFTPEETAQKIKEVVDLKGYDLEKPQDIVRAVKDITKEKSPITEVAKKAIKKTKQPSEVLPLKESAKKLAERPLLGESIKKEEASQKEKAKPLTKKETEKRARAGQEAEKLQKEIDNIKSDIELLREQTSKAKTVKEKALLEQAIKKIQEIKLDPLQRKLENLRGIEKKGRVPFRESDLNEAIDKHNRGLEEYSKNPKSPESQYILDEFKRDEHLIQKGIDLAERGKLPDPSYIDHHIKVLDAYNKSYEQLYKEAKELYEKNPKSKELKRLVDILDKNIKINRSKVAHQKDKISSIDQMRGAKGKLVKQVLKNYRRDIKELQKDFVKQVKQLNESENRISNVANRVLIEKKPDTSTTKLNAEKIPEKIIEKPIEIKDSSIKEESKNLDINEKDLKKSINDIINDLPNILKLFNQNPIQAIFKLRRKISGLPLMKQLAIGSLLSFGMDTLLKDYIPPESKGLLKYAILPSNSLIKLLSIMTGGIIKSRYNDYIINNAAENLLLERNKSLQDAIKFQEKLKSKVSDKEFKEIMNKYKELAFKK